MADGIAKGKTAGTETAGSLPAGIKPEQR